MEYIKLKEDGTFDYEVPTYKNTEWDDRHLCTPQALTPEEAAMFRVVELYPSILPEYNQITEQCVRDGVELVEGKWVYKWRVEQLPPPIVRVPTEITKRQGREQLIEDGLITTIEAFLAAIPEGKQKLLAYNWYDNSTAYLRNNAFLNYAWTALGGTQEELDTLFINASKR